VHYWAHLQSVHGLRCYGNITRTLVTSLRPSPPYDDIVRTLGGVCARCWPVTGGYGGVLNITAGFQWCRFGDITRTQNGSEYMLVLALCLVMAALRSRCGHYIFALWFLSSIFYLFYSSPNLSGRRLDVYHASTHGVALARI